MKSLDFELGVQAERLRLLKALGSYDVRKMLGVKNIKGLKILIQGKK